MPTSPDPEAQYIEARKILPAWGQPDPGGGRRRRAINLLRKAAEAGHHGAMRMLADGLDRKRAGEWSIRLAQRGECGSLVSALTDTDHPPALGLGVLAAARAGEPWAMLAVGRVYGLGMVDMSTNTPVASRDGAWGWLPGEPDPDAAGEAWVARAAEAGWPAALMILATDERDPAVALRHLRAAMSRSDELGPRDLPRAARLEAKLLERLGAPMAEQLEVRMRLADAGDEEAMVWLAARYAAGEAPDLAAARALLERASGLGSVDACRELARLLEGEDLPRARELYEQAAELGGDAFSRDRLATRFGLSWYARG